ncbi:hypothetical protein [Flavihumibacter petaseus]|uniref:T9SS C-terminal target domain-containing protein n=1 Tax=Flavihumibacter petaseus NBRC 106054 TaxID=1220578 RepID=A0A0E9N5K6_9BACT|nr:hypothetical protein [Flavihumibacter petaseus]GAO45088.1 hypothetical protein FPE01S_04_03310 [Flavihumibacter petaseus NBRC 106054]
MKLVKQITAVAVSALMISSCIKVEVGDEYNYPPDGTDSTSKVLNGTIDQSRTLAAGVYTLKGYVYVNNGATLTIEPGTIIKSDVADKGALIIERGSKLIADGRPDAPIIFTSGKAAGERQPGDWGGIILLGKAPTNRPTSPAPIIEGGIGRPYGGTDPNDNSGILRYVRVEFSGIAAEPGSEINGITFGGVGAGTIIENVQVSYGGDDAYEFFGGTVNCKNLVAFGTMDDDYDFDFGYTGKIQYAVSLRDKPADTDQANGIECDNDGSGTQTEPFTRPQLSNLTLIGPYDTTGSSANHGYSNRWRRSTRFVLRNSLLIGHRKAGFSMESKETAQAYKDGLSEFMDNIIAVYKNPYYTSEDKKDGSGNPAPDPASTVFTAAQLQAFAAAQGNTVLPSRDDVQLTDPFNLNAPNFLPKAGSPALTGGNFTGMDVFFTPTTFRGAFGTTNWMEGWTSFNPKNNTY